MATLLELEKQIKNGEPIRMRHWQAHENIRFEPTCDEFVTEEGLQYSVHVLDIFSDSWEVVSKDVQYIGCLCKFWDANITSYTLGILSDINYNSALKYISKAGTSWMHCEPLKPSDVKFYQGE